MWTVNTVVKMSRGSFCYLFLMCSVISGAYVHIDEGLQTEDSTVFTTAPKKTTASHRGVGIYWLTGNWAFNCDFPGNSLSSRQMPGEQCSASCAGTPGCTHYQWTTFNGGTCWMKEGSIRKADAIPSHGAGTVCGVVREMGGESIDWQQGNWAMGCEFPGNDIKNIQIPGERCSAACAASRGCTHFMWTSFNGGTCWMKQGPVDKSKAVVSTDGNSVCGLVFK